MSIESEISKQQMKDEVLRVVEEWFCFYDPVVYMDKLMKQDLLERIKKIPCDY